MAKSARASSKKAARSKIRNSVYAPVEQQRLERLSARLMASISQPSTRTTQSDAMEEDGNSPSPRKSSHLSRKFGSNNIKRKAKRLHSLPRLPSLLSIAHVNSSLEHSANMIEPVVDVTDAANRQEQRTEDRDSSALPQGILFFDLPLPLSLTDEESSGDESEDEAFYRAIGLFGDIQGFNVDNTLRVCLA